jgi:hypothetical protein
MIEPFDGTNRIIKSAGNQVSMMKIIITVHSLSSGSEFACVVRIWDPPLAARTGPQGTCCKTNGARCDRRPGDHTTAHQL